MGDQAGGKAPARYVTSMIPIYNPVLDEMNMAGKLAPKEAGLSVPLNPQTNALHIVEAPTRVVLEDPAMRSRIVEEVGDEHEDSIFMESASHSGALSQVVQGQQPRTDINQSSKLEDSLARQAELREAFLKTREIEGGGDRGQKEGGQQEQPRKDVDKSSPPPSQNQEALTQDTENAPGQSPLENLRRVNAQRTLMDTTGDPTHMLGQQQMTAFVSHHVGHSVESLLKKAYRSEDLEHLDGDDAVNALGLVLKMGGDFTYEHSARVLGYAMDLADEMGVQDQSTRKQIAQGSMLKDLGEMGVMLDSAPQSKIDAMGDFMSSDDVRKAGLLHDVGKVRIPEDILYKPGKLTEEEYGLMKMHPIYSEEMIAPIASLSHLCPTVRAHHERWDGKGYPDGLAGEQIPLAARVLSVADVFDALSASRPYKAGMPLNQVKQIMTEGRGTHFDPEVLDSFMRVLDRRFPAGTPA